jgi:AAA+ ATPase superfamily predicted ATPase
MFVNRREELAALARWFDGPHGRIAMVWGRRRVGKTALLNAFADGRRTIFHTGAGRPARDELTILSRAAAVVIQGSIRDLGQRPFTDWDDALETLAVAAAEQELLLVIDELPEVLQVSPELPGVLRALWDRARERTRLRILLCGSAVRVMQAIEEERQPLYGRIDLTLPLHPFTPRESALMLRGLQPADRALVWGLLGGVPLYLTWWEQEQSVPENLLRLVCSPGARLLEEGRLLLATEADRGELSQLVLRAIAAGRTKHHEIEQAISAEPTRSLERLLQLRLIERLVPVTQAGSRTRRRSYRIADNYLAFWLGLVEPYRAEIERGLGAGIVGALVGQLDNHMGARWEDAMRQHLRALAAEGALGNQIVRIGPFWSERPPVEIDAVALAGANEDAVLLAEAKWARVVDGARIVAQLERSAEALPRLAARHRFAVCARELVKDAPAATMSITAADVFA